MNRHRTLIIALVIVLTPTLSAGAESDVGVRIGWGNAYRAGRWNPIYITSASNPPREVVADVQGTHNAPSAMSIANRFALSPAQSTHAAFFPLGETNDLRKTSLVLRDAETGKRITARNFALNPPLEQAPLGQPLIGVSGDESTWALLKNQFAGEATVGYEREPFLPVVAAGYDALDVLVLNAPDLSKMDHDQQAAIVAWVRGGGTVWMWPGATATPASGPLVDALPAVIGETQIVAIEPSDVESVGLPRIAKVRARQLTPIDGSKPVPLIGAHVTAYRGSIGFGQIVLAPIDLATLRFTSNVAARKFWSPMFHGVPDRTRDNVPDAKIARWLRDARADRSRSIPAWLIVALVIVGPLDSVLLKLLGRRPWTVVTVLGWAGLIGTVTLAARERGRDRPTEYRTVRITDEIDHSIAMVTHFVGLRWPEGTSLMLPREDGWWWQPAIDPTDPPDGPRSELRAEQSEGGTWPTRLAAHVPTPRVLQSQKWTASPGIIEAKLSLQGNRVVGTIKNRGERPLANVRVRVAGGVASVEGKIAPGTSLAVDTMVESGDRSLDIPEPERFYSARRATDTPVLLPDYAAIQGSTFARSTQILERLTEGRACVYAVIEDPPPPMELSPPITQRHMAFVRSVVRLE